LKVFKKSSVTYLGDALWRKEDVVEEIIKFLSLMNEEKYLLIRQIIHQIGLMTIFSTLVFQITILVIIKLHSASVGIPMGGILKKRMVLNISFPYLNQNSFAFKKQVMDPDLEVITLVELLYQIIAAFSKEKKPKFLV